MKLISRSVVMCGASVVTISFVGMAWDMHAHRLEATDLAKSGNQLVVRVRTILDRPAVAERPRGTCEIEGDTTMKKFDDACEPLECRLAPGHRDLDGEV